MHSAQAWFSPVLEMNGTPHTAHRGPVIVSNLERHASQRPFSSSEFLQRGHIGGRRRFKKEARMFFEYAAMAFLKYLDKGCKSRLLKNRVPADGPFFLPLFLREGGGGGGE